MHAGIIAHLSTLGWILLAGLAIVALTLVLSLILRKRMTPGLVPRLFDVIYHPDAKLRFIALLGHQSPARETLGLHRLRATFGLKLVFWLLTAGLVLLWATMDPATSAAAMLFLPLAAYLAIHTTLYEITYTRDTITLPRWWFGRTTQKWRDLDATVERMGWYLDFHFRDGTVIQAHRYIVGYSALREIAEKAMREA